MEMTAAPGQAPESRIGDRIRFCRSQLRMNVAQLSRRCYEIEPDGDGISHPTLTRYEMDGARKALRLPSAEALRILCEALHVPIEWLMFGRVPSGDAQ